MTVYRERIPSTDPRLNRHIHHDERSRAYAFDTSGLEIVSAKHVRRIPVLDQGNLGSCTGNAGIGCLGTDPFYATVPSRLQPLLVAQGAYPFTEDGAVQLYSDATKIDPYDGTYPPTDSGSDGLSIAKVLKAAGQIAGYQHTFSLDDALKALGQYPVICGTVWYQSMFEPRADGQLVVDASSGVAGGHEYVVDEIDADTGRVWMTNSWGSDWSLNGRAWLSWDDWGDLLDAQGDVTVFTPLTQPAPTPTPADPADAAFAAVLRHHDWVHRHHVLDNAKVASAGRTWLDAKGL